MDDLELDVAAAKQLLQEIIGESQAQLTSSIDVDATATGSLGAGFLDYEQRLLQLFAQLHTRTNKELHQIHEYGVQALAQVQAIEEAEAVNAQSFGGEQ